MMKWRDWVRDRIAGLYRIAREDNARLVALETCALPDLPQTVEQHEASHRDLRDRIDVLGQRDVVTKARLERVCERLERVEEHCYGDEQPPCDHNFEWRGPDPYHMHCVACGSDVSTPELPPDDRGDDEPQLSGVNRGLPERCPIHSCESLPVRWWGLPNDQVCLCSFHARQYIAEFGDRLASGAPQAPEPRSWDEGLAECRSRGLMCGMNSFPGGRWRAWLYRGTDVVATRYGAGMTEALWAALDAQNGGASPRQAG